MLDPVKKPTREHVAKVDWRLAGVDRDLVRGSLDGQTRAENKTQRQTSTGLHHSRCSYEPPPPLAYSNAGNMIQGKCCVMDLAAHCKDFSMLYPLLYPMVSAKAVRNQMVPSRAE